MFREMITLNHSSNKRRSARKNLAKGLCAVVLAASCTLGYAALSPVFALDEPKSDIDKLETKFFRHMYPKDTNAARLDRLEKMVFGETKSGSEQERISSLLKLVSEDDLRQASSGGTGRGASGRPAADSGGSGANTASNADGTSDNASNTASKASGGSSPASDDASDADYPAVTAIEKKLLGRDYHDENVESRLARLEKKVFKQVSSSNDLSERMDNLKAATGVDIARKPPAGADWDDEESDTDFPAPNQPVSRRVPGVSPRYGGGDDAGSSFSGRNVAQDLNNAFGRTPGGSALSGSGSYGMGGSGSYGMGGTGSITGGGSGSYGFGRGTPPLASSGSNSFGRSSGYGGSSGLGSSGYRGSSGSGSAGYGSAGSGSSYSSSLGGSGLPSRYPSGLGSSNKLAYTPRTAPGTPLDDDDTTTSGMPPVAPTRAGGLTAQVDALEQQVFGKTFKKDGLTQRLDRLENVVNPGDKSSKSKNAPERIARLAQVIPIGVPSAISQNQNPDQYQSQNQYQAQDAAQNSINPNVPDPGQVAQAPQKRGLSRILGAMGNLFTGGTNVGGYSMASGGLVTDPTTGNLVDQTTGNIIDPHTGQIIGRRAINNYAGCMMGGAGYGFNSFNTGFSPYSSPYGNPYGGFGGSSIYGIGGSGMRFGTGLGGIRFGGGMWP